MPNTYFDSDLTGEQIENALNAIHGVVTPENNGKVLVVENGKIAAKSASAWTDTPVLEPLSVTANGDYTPGAGVDGYNSVHVAVSGAGNIQPLSVTQNGIYNPPSGVDGYAPVTVNVSGGGGSGNILTGTDEPTSSVGSNGQIYLLYGSLPGGYTQVEYLEINNSGPYIDTEIVNTPTAYFEIVGNWTQIPGDNEGFFGAQTTDECAINSWSGNQFIRVGSSGSNISTPLVKHKYTANSNGIFIDDTLVGTPNWNNPTNRSYYLFAINYYGGVLRASHARIYKCDIYDDNSLVKSFVPAVRSSDSVAGMFDLIESRFYQNAGTGSFIAGDPVQISQNITFAYLKVNGQWQSLIGSDVNDVNLGGN